MMLALQKEAETHGLAELTRRQQKALAAVMAAKTVDAGLKVAKVSRKTFYTWLKQEHFKSAYDKARSELLEDALHNLRGHLTAACDTLASLLATHQPSPTRLRAAIEIIGIIVRSDQSIELEKRIAALEAAQLQNRR